MPQEALEHWRSAKGRGVNLQRKWMTRFAAYIASRAASGTVIDSLGIALPELIVGSTSASTRWAP